MTPKYQTWKCNMEIAYLRLDNHTSLPNIDLFFQKWGLTVRILIFQNFNSSTNRYANYTFYSMFFLGEILSLANNKIKWNGLRILQKVFFRIHFTKSRPYFEEKLSEVATFRDCIYEDFETKLQLTWKRQ